MATLSLLPLLLVACGGTEPAKPVEKKPAKPACELTFATLPGGTFLRQNVDGKKENISRVRFFDEGGKLKANYTAGSPNSVYTYACTEKSGMLDCLEEKTYNEAWCKAYASVHDGVCDPAVLGPMIGLTADQLKADAEKVNKELKGLKGEEKTRQREVDNTPNNKIRSHFVAAIDAGKCQLTLQDKYLTMFNGQVQEYENQNGTSNFVKEEGEFFWETVTEKGVIVVGEDGKPVAGPYPAGSLKFSADLGEKVKADPNCAYMADIYVDWKRASSDMPANVEGGKATWSTSGSFTTGIHAVYFDRYKTCGSGAKEKIGATQLAFRVQ